MPEETNNIELSRAIEAILFAKGEPMTIRELSQSLQVTEGAVNDALRALEGALDGHGIALMRKDDSVALATAPSEGARIAAFRKAELEKELSKASVETLAVILYKDGATRSEIDYIRGVNAGFTLRNLMMRGLIERITDPSDSRKYLYRPTFDLLAYLGVRSVSELPEFADIRNALLSNVAEQPADDAVPAA